MAKTNNKGFTLIEIVIAVAILSLLLTPVVNQFAQTMETSRKAKALQEANETATKEVEEFQSYSLEELETKYGSSNITESSHTVALYTRDGNTVKDKDNNDVTLTYKTYEYNLGSTKIGAKNYVYANTVVLDDLSNQIRDYAGTDASGNSVFYKIAYNITDAEIQALKGKAPDGKDFELTNEGSAVYEDGGYVSAIVCTDKNADNSDVSHVDNPNTVNLGNMQNLDKNTVALVMGGTSSYDSQAYSALYARAMDKLRGYSEESWKQALVNTQSILDDIQTSERLIKIYTNKETDSSNGPTKEYYVVKVDVYYTFEYELKPKDEVKECKDYISYTVFSQNFYTEEAPDIYFEYQPYSYRTDTDNNVEYEANDYILFDNHVDETKLYLYKPYKDQQTMQMYVGTDANAEDNKANIEKLYYDISKYYTKKDTDGDGVGDTYTYYTTPEQKDPVKIHLLSTTPAGTNVYINQNTGKELAENQQERIYVFTNLNIEGYTDTDDESDPQFVADDDGSRFTSWQKEDNTTINILTDDDGKALSVNKFVTKYNLIRKNDAGEVVSATDPTMATMDALYALSDDIRESERLYTITVQLKPDDTKLNTVRLSGAKGAN